MFVLWRWLAVIAWVALGCGLVKAQVPSTGGPSTTVRWYGQDFMYLISSTGIRVAMDPYSEGTVDYPFPARLPADVVLISNEGDLASAGERLFGSPQIFRSTTAVGLNNARGDLFRGVETYLDNKKGAQLGENTAFSFEMDGVRFAHLGDIGHALTSEQRKQLGSVDVLFLPVGNPAVSIADLRKTAAESGAKIIVPMGYATAFTVKQTLRKLDEFTEGASNVQLLDSNEFTVNPQTLPATPRIFILKIASVK